MKKLSSKTITSFILVACIIAVGIFTVTSVKRNNLTSTSNEIKSQKTFDSKEAVQEENIPEVISPVEEKEITNSTPVLEVEKETTPENQEETVTKVVKAEEKIAEKNNKKTEAQQSEEKTPSVETTTENKNTVQEQPKEEISNKVLETTYNGDSVTVYRDFFKVYQIWFAEFTCDTSKCEGFNEHNSTKKTGTILEGRRGEIESITMKAPAAKDGHKFVKWQEYKVQYSGLVIRGYEAIYE